MIWGGTGTLSLSDFFVFTFFLRTFLASRSFLATVSLLHFQFVKIISTLTGLKIISFRFRSGPMESYGIISSSKSFPPEIPVKWICILRFECPTFLKFKKEPQFISADSAFSLHSKIFILYPRHFTTLPHHPKSSTPVLTEWFCGGEDWYHILTIRRLKSCPINFMMLEIWFEQLKTGQYHFVSMFSISWWFCWNDFSGGKCVITMISGSGKPKLEHCTWSRELSNPPQ